MQETNQDKSKIDAQLATNAFVSQHERDFQAQYLQILETFDSKYSLFVLYEYHACQLFIILVSLFLVALYINYGIGQLLSSEINFLCDTKTAQEVWANSKAINSSIGSSDSCWLIDQPTVSYELQDNVTLDWDDGYNVLTFLLFLCLACILITIIIYNTYLLFYDILYDLSRFIDIMFGINCSKFFNCCGATNEYNDNIHQNVCMTTVDKSVCTKTNPRITKSFWKISKKLSKQLRKHLVKLSDKPHLMKQKSNNSKTKNNNKQCDCKCKCDLKCMIQCLPNCYKTFIKYFKIYLRFISRNKYFLMLYSELIEIVTQTFSLLIMGGVQIIDSDDYFSLSEESEVVGAFSKILALNCIISGIIWFINFIIHICHLKLKHITNISNKRSSFEKWVGMLYDICHSTIYQLIIFIIDVIFDLIYVIYPSTIYLGNKANLFYIFEFDFNDPNVRESLSQLNTKTKGLTLALIVSSMLLTFKSYRMLKKENIANIIQLEVIQIYKNKVKQLYNNLNTSNATSNATSNTTANTIANKSTVNLDTTTSNAHLKLSGTSIQLNTIESGNSSNIINGDEDSDDDQVISTIDSLRDETNHNHKSHNIGKIMDKIHKNKTELTTITTATTRDIGAPGALQQTEIGNETGSNSSPSNELSLPVTLYVGFIGLIFIVYGVFLFVSVESYLNDSYQFCANPSDYNDNIYQTHPELYFWDNCQTKVYPLLRSIPYSSKVDKNTLLACDCQNFKINIDENVVKSYNVSSKHLQSIFQHWTMLYRAQILFDSNGYLEYTILNNNEYDKMFINLTKEYNSFGAKKLALLQLNYVPVGYIDNGMTQWTNLQIVEIESAQFIDKSVESWEKTFGSLKNIKLLDLDNNFQLKLNSTIMESFLCKLTDLVEVSFSGVLIESIPDCISNLNELIAIQVDFCSSLSYLSYNVFTLPNIVYILAYYSNITVSTFVRQDNNNTSTQFNIDDVSNSLKRVFLQGYFDYSLCNDVTNRRLLLNSDFEQFVNDYDACWHPCSNSTINTASLFLSQCSTFEYFDGNCDISCNSQECGWDGGDCYQLCDFNKCNSSMWNNGICDTACNSSKCNFDFGDCSGYVDDVSDNSLDIGGSVCYNETAITFDTDDDGNVSIIATNVVCYSEWVNDELCDLNCEMASECYYDGSDCSNGCSGTCQEVYEVFVAYIATINPPYELVDSDEICQLWGVISNIVTTEYDFKNCTHFYNQANTNNDAYLTLHEILVIIADYFGYTQERAMQVDCSMCMQNQSLYW